MRRRALCALCALAILALVPCGCATLTYRDSVALKAPFKRAKHPRYSNGGYANQYCGTIKGGDTEYFTFTFMNPFLVGDRPGRSGNNIGVFVPVDPSTGNRAVLFEHNQGGRVTIQIEAISACLRKNHVPDKLIAAYRTLMWNAFTGRDAYHAAAYTSFSRKELFALEGYAELAFQAHLPPNVSSMHGEPEIVGFLLDEKQNPVQLFLARWPLTAQDEPGWEWSGPYEVSACLTQPTLGQKFLPVAYVFTVAVDVATSPLQLLIGWPLLLGGPR